MQLTLNIGTAIAATSQHNTVSHIVQTLDRAGFDISSLSVWPSPTGGERTVCVECTGERSGIESACVLLGQDAIAVYVPAQSFGFLVGPKASEWGPFDSRSFLTIDGAALSDSVPVLRVA